MKLWNLFLVSMLLYSCRQEKPSSPEQSPASIQQATAKPSPKDALQEAEPAQLPRLTEEKIRERLLASSRRVSAIEIDTTLHDLEESRRVRTIIAEELLNTLEVITVAPTQYRRGITSRLSAIADKWILVNRADQLKRITVPTNGLLAPHLRSKIQALKTEWSREPALATQVENYLSSQSLLNCEHIPEMLLNWTESNGH